VVSAFGASRDEFGTRTGHADSIAQMQGDSCQESTRARVRKD
jgi:hypothetical protein